MRSYIRDGLDEGTTDVKAVPITSRHEVTQPITPSTRLVCLSGPDQGCSYRVCGPVAGIGRAGPDIKLRASDVSRHHARLTARVDGMYIEDLGSSNGTYVNGVAIARPTRLCIGDRVQLGTTILVFTHHDDLEERVRQLQKLDAIGAAVSGVAHDFNNALQSIVIGLQEIAVHRAEDRVLVDDMRLAADAAIALARRLVTLGRNEPPTFETLRVATLVDECVRMTSRLVDSRIAVTVTGNPLCELCGSRNELQQVIVNLILNARDAIAERGTIRIAYDRVIIDAATALARQLPTREKGREYVAITVTDTGCGMDEATLARAFEPFFTTKSTGKGTGLGLAVVHATVRRHGGTVEIQSRKGAGTTFRILVPSAS